MTRCRQLCAPKEMKNSQKHSKPCILGKLWASPKNPLSCLAHFCWFCVSQSLSCMPSYMCRPPPEGQWCGKKGMCVTHAFADLLASRPLHITELDLSKAFDHLWLQLAEVSMIHLGVPVPIAQLLCKAWTGPRICAKLGLGPAVAL